MAILSHIDDIAGDASIEDVEDTVKELFLREECSEEQRAKGLEISGVLALACKAIFRLVPPCSDRTAAIRKLREADSDCWNGITFDGRF